MSKGSAEAISAKRSNREGSARRIEERPISSLRPYPGNARAHSKRQIRQLADGIARFGFTNPVLISGGHTILAGHGRVVAAKLLGMRKIPAVCLSHLTSAEHRAYTVLIGESS